jgi:hypothetical protein
MNTDLSMNKTYLIFISCSLLFVQFARAGQAEVPHDALAELNLGRLRQVAQSETWYRLMHYKHFSPFGELRSEISGAGFFFSPEGSKNPLAELRASVEAFASNRPVGQLHQPAQCAFPERYRFVKKELNLNLHDKEVPCPELDQFMAQFDAESVTLVFSGGRQDSPATMFGHTFLRLNSRKKGQSELLDQGLSFAAVAPPDDGPLVFYWLGMTGGYQGHFSKAPYYLKVNEYTNSESRDLWEYKLNLTREETETLLRHAWEIETNSWINYYFFDGNCSYELMALLEVARPDWHLTPFTLYDIPGETVKRITRTQGAVSEVTYRPSLKKKLEKKIHELSRQDRDDFYSLIHGDLQADQISSAGVLDAAALYYIFEKQKQDGKLPADALFKMRLVLKRRSELAATSASTHEVAWSEHSSEHSDELAPSTRPDLGHDAIQLGVSGGVARYGEGRGSPTLFQEISIRSAYHDLLNDDTGFSRFSQIVFPSLALRYYPAPETFEVDRLTLLSIVSLFPVSRIEATPSWQLSLEYESPKDSSCDDCHALHLQGGSGVTAELFTPAVLGSFFVLGDMNAGNWEASAQGRWYRGGPGFQAAVLSNPFPGFKSRFSETTLTDLLPSSVNRSLIRYELSWENSFRIATEWDARVSWSSVLHGTGTRTYNDEAMLTLNRYF